MKSAISKFGRRLAFALMLTALPGFGVVAAEVTRVPGTRISLEAPAEFLPATEFQGFEKRDQGASILVSEIPIPFASYRETFSREELEKRNLFLEESGRWSIDGQDGLLLRVSDASGGRVFEAWVLIFGDGRYSVLIFGSYPKDLAGSLGPDVRRSLLTARWEPTGDVGEFEGLPFEVEPTRELELATRMPDGVVLTPGGVAGRVNPDDAFLFVGTAPGAIDFGNFESTSREHLEKSGLFSEIGDISGRLVSVDGMTGYELTAKASDARDGTALAVYQLILGEDRRQFRALGIVGEARAARFLPEFEAVAHSLRRTR